MAPGKEWKPKPTTLVLAQELGTEVPVIPAEVSSKPRSSIPESKERKVETSHISDGQHVIIPNHLHVAEVEKLGFQFGSFDASFGLNSSALNGPTSDKSPSPEASEEIAEHIEEQTTRFALMLPCLLDYICNFLNAFFDRLFYWIQESRCVGYG